MHRTVPTLVCIVLLGLTTPHSWSVDPVKRDKVKSVQAVRDLLALDTQIQLYRAQFGLLPTTEQGLQVLVAAPTSDPKPRKWRALMLKLPVDPWGQAYCYEAKPGGAGRGYRLYSLGPDGQPGTKDDVSHW